MSEKCSKLTTNNNHVRTSIYEYFITWLKNQKYLYKVRNTRKNCFKRNRKTSY